jgi:hypothetical protein
MQALLEAYSAAKEQEDAISKELSTIRVGIEKAMKNLSKEDGSGKRVKSFMVNGSTYKVTLSKTPAVSLVEDAEEVLKKHLDKATLEKCYDKSLSKEKLADLYNKKLLTGELMDSLFVETEGKPRLTITPQKDAKAIKGTGHKKTPR